MALQVQLGAPVSPGPSPWRKRLVWILIIVGAIIFSLWAVSSAVDLTIWGAYNHFIDNLTIQLGINRYLANVISLVFIAPFFLGIKMYLFSVRDRERKQRLGLVLLLGLGVLYNLALYFGTRDQNFGPSGAIRYYALVPGGVVFSDHPGTEPKFGLPFRPVSQDNVKWLMRIKQGRIAYVAEPGNHDWFDLVTGDPLMWYSTDRSGNYRFFDGPGHDPATSADLKPVTPEIRDLWEKKESSLESKRAKEAAVNPPADQNTPSPQPPGAQGTATQSTQEPAIQETYQKVFSGDFLFELHACVLRGKNLICDFTVTNDLDSDREFRLRIYWGTASRVLDENGNEYISKSGQLGSKSGTPGISGLGETLVSGIKTRASLEFEEVPPQTKVAKVLRVVFQGHTFQDLTADFRDVPIQVR